MTPEEHQRAREDVLIAAYELSNGDTFKRIDPEPLFTRAGVDEDAGTRATRWHIDHKHLEHVSLAGDFSITTRGIDAAEEALRGRTPRLSVQTLSSEEYRAVEAFLGEYRRSADENELGLDAESAADADVQAQSLALQLKSPRPRRRVVKVLLAELHAVLQGCGSSAVWAALVKVIDLVA